VSRIGYLERYLETSADILRQLPVVAIDGVIGALVRALEAERFIYVMGNGSSAANAEPFVNDLSKGGMRGFPRRFKVVSLASNVPLLTAWANDTEYADVFAVVRALTLARARGAVTVGLTGGDGGKLKSLCDHCLVVASDNMQHIEELHLVVLHAIYSAIRDLSMPPET
jgi:D-sedoheptulose 7-phosphate isomerase